MCILQHNSENSFIKKHNWFVVNYHMIIRIRRMKF